MGLSTDFFGTDFVFDDSQALYSLFTDNVHRFLLDVRVLLKTNLVTWISSENSTLLDRI